MSSYDLLIKGFKDPIRVESGAEKAKGMWEEYLKTKRDQVITLSGWTGRLSDIRSFRYAEQSRSSDNKTHEATQRHYTNELYRRRALSPSQRSKELGFFRLLYWGFTKQRSEDVPEIEAKARSIQEEFYNSNPKRVLPDPILFKPLITQTECDPSVMSILENQIRQENFAVKHL